MQSNEKQIFLRKYGMALLIACVVILTAGGALAKYVTSNQRRAEMESSQFHISSDYLEEGDSASYTVADWGSGFDIQLYNYEKDNVAQISQVDMTYTVTAENATVSVRDQAGNELSGDAGSYQFDKITEIAHHVLHVQPNDNVGVGKGKAGTITVTVTTTSPYSKTLTATFNIQNNSEPDYTIKDQNDGTVLITVKTNEHQGSMKVTWDSGKYSPDNNNVLMSEWLDGTSTGTGTFPVNRNSTYELLFFKNGAVSCTDTTGNGTEITLN